MRARFRRILGFTLVELLVVIAIIGILIALLLPAVQAAREAAKRAQCTNNLKQMALAVHNYHDTHKSMPLGGATGWGHTWHCYILPFMEQQGVYDGIRWSDSGYANNSRPTDPFTIMARTVIPAFKCPSEQEADRYWKSMNNVSRRAVGSYLGNAGGNLTTDGRRAEPAIDARSSNGVLLAFAIRTSTARHDPIGFAQIRDGLSNTLLIGESPYSVIDPCVICDRLTLYSNNADSGQGSDWSEYLGSTFYPINVSMDTNAPFANNTVEREMSMGSYHPGGLNGALCDGSIRFIAETIDINVWRAVGSRDEGEVMDSGW